MSNQPHSADYFGEQRDFWWHRDESESVETLVARFEFWLRQHRGRLAAGQGNHSIGDVLPGYFAQLGLQSITVHQNDRPASLFPPYASEAQQVLLAQNRQWAQLATGPYEKDSLRGLFLKGGGLGTAFESAYAALLKTYQAEQQALAADTYHSAGGSLNYLVAGRKPRPAVKASPFVRRRGHPLRPRTISRRSSGAPS